MSARGAESELYRQRFAALEKDRAPQHPEWLTTLRREALELFSADGFPDPRAEEWRYTNVRPIVRREFQPTSDQDVAFERDWVAQHAIERLDAYELVFCNGRFEPELSYPDRAPEGCHIETLSAVVARTPDRLRNHLGAAAGYRDNSFAALNTAFFEDGVYIELTPGTRLDRPIRLAFFSLGEEQALIAHPRVLVVAGRESEAAFIEHYLGLDANKHFVNPLTEVHVGDGAAVDHYLLQQHSTDAFHIGSVHVNQFKDSRYRSHNINLGGRLVRHDLNVKLSEPGAEALLNGLFMGSGRQHVDNHTRITHAAPHSRSRENYKGVLDGHARGVFKGSVLVERNAQKIEAHQSNSNLLLSANAEVDTKPELQIYADDVVCSHGATVGQLDPVALFYLLSRGIDQETARGLMTFAFADEVVAQIGLQAIREKLEAIIVRRLPDSETLKEFV